MESKKMVYFRKALQLGGGIICAAMMIYGYRSGWFTSKEQLGSLLEKAGIFAPIIFILIQVIQVIIPILPGAIGCVAGVWFFGIWYGCLYNYIGICIGSLLVFLIARRYGTPILSLAAGPKLIQRYQSWLTINQKKFDWLFALAILFPVAPDDFLCYMAGTTKIAWQKFTAIILVAKPWSILAYSLLLNMAVTGLQNFII